MPKQNYELIIRTPINIHENITFFYLFIIIIILSLRRTADCFLMITNVA